MVPADTTKLMTDMRRGSLRFCVLALIQDRERYGFEIAKCLSEADGLLTSEGTLYPLLARLRKEGLVETDWRESTQGPPRRYYSLAPEGRTALKVFREQWNRFRDAVDGVLEEGAA